MNLTFQITKSYEYEFTTRNLINSDLVIQRISISTDKFNLGTCLLLDAINNNIEQKQGVMNGGTSRSVDTPRSASYPVLSQLLVSHYTTAPSIVEGSQ